VARVCRQVGGIPLAIELAVLRLRDVPVADLEALLDDQSAAVSGDRRSRPPRHRTMRAAIAWSHDLCEPSERLLWARLSAFPGDFDRTAAVRTCADGRLPAGQVVEALAGLVDKSIVLAEKRLGRCRYRLPGPLRQFGQQLSREHGDLRAPLRADRDGLGQR
jgi:non-specific serine/threonine protein kinase